MHKINEVTRNTLIDKSRKAVSTTNKNRWEAKSECSLASTSKDYNKIDMDNLWKNNTLIVKLKIKGESSIYLVTVEFSNLLDAIRLEIKNKENDLTFKIIYDAFVKALNSSNIKISCTCPDFIYRFKYQASKNGYNSGKTETRPAKKTNPNNTLGSSCKHVLFALNNAEWVQKISKIIYNYILYAKDNLNVNYKKFIFPKLFNITYDEAVKKLSDKDKADLDTSLSNISNFLIKQ